MGPYLGDYAEDAIIHKKWDSNAGDGASITRATDGTISVYKADGTTQSVAGVTDTEDFDGLTGVHHVKIDTSADAFYAVGNDYDVVLSGATIDGKTVNATLFSFSIENRFVRGTDSAALATVCTEGRLAELDAGNLPTDVAAVKSETALIKTEADKIALTDGGAGAAGSVIEEVQNGALASVCTEARLAELDAGNLPTDIAGLNDPDAAAIADAVWDELLTGATHNIATSAGRRLRELAAAFTVHSGTAQAGSTSTTIKLDTGASTQDNIYRGDRIVVVAGLGVQEHGICISYVGSTRVATMAETWVITPDDTTEFEIVPATVDVETIQHAIQTAGDLAALIVTVKSETALIKTEADKIALVDAGAGVAGSVVEEVQNGALASVCTEARLAELDAGNLPTDIAGLNDLSAADVNAEVDTALADVNLDHLVGTASGIPAVPAGTFLDQVLDDGTATYDRTTDSLQAVRDRGDSAWITGGGGGITDILNVLPLIPLSIDLAATATVRLGLMLVNSLDDLPSTAEITPGTISIHRKAIGGTSWSAVETDAACLESNGLVYFDEVFDGGSGYAEGDSIRVTFKSQKITVAANDYEISDATGRMFQTEIRQTMRGTDSAALASVCTEPRLAELDAGNLPTDVAATALASVCTEARLAELDAGNLPTDIAGLNDLSPAQVNAEVDTALADANLDHIAGTATGIPSLPAGTYLDQARRTAAGTYDRDTDSQEALRDRGDAAWITGGAGAITDIIHATPLIPATIDLAVITNIVVGFMLTNQLDDLPSAAEITPGTVTVLRKPRGAIGFQAVVTNVACEALDGRIIYSRAYDTGAGFAAGDQLSFHFKNQKVTVAGNDYEICDAAGQIFYSRIVDDLPTAVNVTLGPAVASADNAARTASPIPLEMFQLAEHAFVITVNDVDGVAVDMSAMTLRFVVHDENEPPNDSFQIEEGAGIVVSGDDNEVATVTVNATHSATAGNDLRWRLWDTVGDILLAHGSFTIRPASKGA